MQTRIDLEASVAACVLMAGGQNVLHVDLALEDFLFAPARAVIGAARQLQTIDILLVRKWAEENELAVKSSDLSALLNVVPTTRNFMNYLVQLKEEIYRQKIEALRKATMERAKQKEDLLTISKWIEAEEARLSQHYLEKIPATDLSAASVELINRIDQGIDNENLVPTGWPMLDKMFAGGFLPNELIIIAARPGVGKTAAALQLAVDCQKKVVMFSLEMSKAQIVPRILAALSLTNTKIAARKPSQVPESVRKNLLQAAPSLLEAAERIIVLDQPDQTIETVRRYARREVDAGATMVIIDYLQLLDCKNAESRERAVAQISRELKNMSKELNVPVICLAQMNRSVENEKRLPRLSDLRESGAIEQDANAVLFIQNVGEMANDQQEVLFYLAKGRDVGQDFCKGYFVPDHQRYYAKAGA